MDDIDPDDDMPDESPEPISTCCHACGGAGWVPQPVQSMHHGFAHTATYAQPCPWCDDGRLLGIVAPS